MNNKKRKNSQAPIALVYFITLLVFILVFGIIAYTILNNVVLKDKEDTSSTLSVVDNVPTDKDNQTFLYMLTDGKSSLESAMVVRFMPKNGKLYLVPLSPYTITTYKGQTITLNKLAKSGTAQLASAIESELGITIDKYLALDNTAFVDLCDNLGSVTYQVFEDMYYISKTSDDVVNFEKGEKLTLDGNTIRLLLTYPNYKGGVSQNVKVAGDLMQSLINTSFKVSSTKDRLQSIYTSLIKSAKDKTFTGADFEKTKYYYKYLIDNSNNPAEAITPTGTWAGSSPDTFKMSDSFKTQIKDIFEIK